MDEFDWERHRRGPDRPQLPFEIQPKYIFPALWGAALLFLLVWGVLTSYYTVEANEEAVILRLGTVHGVTGPGFHGKLPFGIDEVHKGEVKTVHREEFGYRTLEAGVKSRFDYTSPEVVAEATMLTGDLNLAMANWEVRYRIRDLEKYLFNVRDPIGTLRSVSEAVMHTEMGDRSVDEVLTLDRTVIENRVQEKMQAQLDHFGCGLRVVKVNLKRVDPPEPVREAFNAVNQAIQVRDRIINDAEGVRNQKIPAARGARERTVREAEGYKIGRINRARGETEAFLAVLDEYRKAEDITRRRLFLEAMAATLPKVGDVTMVDDDTGGVLKLLDLDEQPRGKTKNEAAGAK